MCDGIKNFCSLGNHKTKNLQFSSNCLLSGGERGGFSKFGGKWRVEKSTKNSCYCSFFLYGSFIKRNCLGVRQASSHYRCHCTQSSILDTLSTFYPIYIIFWLKPTVTIAGFWLTSGMWEFGKCMCWRVNVQLGKKNMQVLHEEVDFYTETLWCVLHGYQVYSTTYSMVVITRSLGIQFTNYKVLN